MSKIIHCTTRSTPAFVIREERILFFMILWLAYYDSHCYQFSRALLRNMMLATHRNPLPATLIKCYPIRLLSCCSFNFSLSLNYAVWNCTIAISRFTSNNSFQQRQQSVTSDLLVVCKCVLLYCNNCIASSIFRRRTPFDTTSIINKSTKYFYFRRPLTAAASNSFLLQSTYRRVIMKQYVRYNSQLFNNIYTY